MRAQASMVLTGNLMTSATLFMAAFDGGVANLTGQKGKVVDATMY
jgi:hypothetical protein